LGDIWVETGNLPIDPGAIGRLYPLFHGETCLTALPRWIRPQLTRLVDMAPEGEGWLHEIKYDGYHALDQEPRPYGGAFPDPTAPANRSG
jgi:hypothetical protein